MNRSPVFRDIVLAGGGHSHALVVRHWGMQPLPGVRLTLISPEPLTPYSGMLPGYLAGHYRHAEMHIDLVRLCQWAGVRLLQDQVIGLNTGGSMLYLAGRPPLEYDILSLNTGATPAQDVPGVAEHAIPVKPIAGFIAEWQRVLARLRACATAQHLVMVGGGAGSVEALLALAHATGNDSQIAAKPRFTLITRNATLLPGYPRKVVAAVLARCARLQVAVLTNLDVAAVTANVLHGNTGSGSTSVAFDQLFWCTQAAAPGWLQDSGLALDESGFVRVGATLQSSSHATVFAAGDIARFDPAPLAKAGVYAVRQAPVLYTNLRRVLLGTTLRRYRPQRNFLSLLALGDRVATGNRGPLAVSGAWVWHWKNRIDQAFMAKFRDLPALPMHPPQHIHPRLIPAAERQEPLRSEERCSGCGGKLGAAIVDAVFTELRGVYQPEDAAVSNWPGQQLLQSIDQLRAPISDLYRFGRIATRHALNDLYAVNAEPRSLLVAVGLPFAGRAVQGRELRQLMQGVVAVCVEEAVELLGGHSAESAEVTLTLAVNGSPGSRTFGKRGMRTGQLLILGKPLGSGIVLAAHMHQRAAGPALAAALEVMDSSPRLQAMWLAEAGVECCTDVSGFGLLGHLDELLAGTLLQVELDLAAVPLLPETRSLADAGVRSSLFTQNEARALQQGRWQALQAQPLWPILLDPQTSGGLLAAIDADYAEPATALGFSVIGRVL